MKTSTLCSIAILLLAFRLAPLRGYAQTCVPSLPDNSYHDSFKWQLGDDPEYGPKEWRAYIKEDGNLVPTIIMPFFRTVNTNTADESIESIQVPDGLVPDYLHEDGWELLTKKIGSPLNFGTGIYTPAWIMYNKYSATLRVLIYPPRCRKTVSCDWKGRQFVTVAP